MLIVDSQVYVWAADRPDRPRPQPAHGLKPAPQRVQPISAQALLDDMRVAGVDRALLVPPSWEGERNDVVPTAGQRYPDRYRFAARLDFNAPGARAISSPTGARSAAWWRFSSPSRRRCFSSG